MEQQHTAKKKISPEQTQNGNIALAKVQLIFWLKMVDYLTNVVIVSPLIRFIYFYSNGWKKHELNNLKKTNK